MHLWRIPYSTHGGLLARAAPGTHETAVSLLESHAVPKTGPVLDLAAGTGALLSRLHAHGFSNLHGVERDLPQFGFPLVQPRALDLNTNFSIELGQGNFSLVTAIEIIEHLDCPRHFIAEIFNLLAPGGYALLSTPNVAHWLSRVHFLFTGVPKFFTQEDFLEQRHISPILDHHMRIMLQEVGFDWIGVRTAASSWGFFMQALSFPLRLFFRICTKGPHTEGNIHFYLVRKKAD